MLTRRLLIIATLTACLVTQGGAQDKSIVVATTSTQDSGLFGYLLPIFTQKTGIAVKVVAQGTDQFERSCFNLDPHPWQSRKKHQFSIWDCASLGNFAHRSRLTAAGTDLGQGF
jgi:hypothetical protein